MFGLRFSKLPGHRQFNYTPLYYDEGKEKLDAQVKQIRREQGLEKASSAASVEERIRSAYRSRQYANRHGKASSRKTYGLKIVLIALFLGYVFYKILNSKVLETIFGI